MLNGYSSLRCCLFQFVTQRDDTFVSLYHVYVNVFCGKNTPDFIYVYLYMYIHMYIHLYMRVCGDIWSYTIGLNGIYMKPFMTSHFHSMCFGLFACFVCLWSQYFREFGSVIFFFLHVNNWMIGRWEQLLFEDIDCIGAPSVACYQLFNLCRR